MVDTSEQPITKFKIGDKVRYYGDICTVVDLYFVHSPLEEDNKNRLTEMAKIEFDYSFYWAVDDMRVPVQKLSKIAASSVQPTYPQSSGNSSVKMDDFFPAQNVQQEKSSVDKDLKYLEGLWVLYGRYAGTRNAYINIAGHPLAPPKLRDALLKVVDEDYAGIVSIKESCKKAHKSTVESYYEDFYYYLGKLHATKDVIVRTQNSTETFTDIVAWLRTREKWLKDTLEGIKK